MDDLDRFLREDLGPRGDVTTRLVFGQKRIPARARVYARTPIVAAGLLEASEVFRRLGCTARRLAREGASVGPGRTLLDITGPLQSILMGERLALNLVGRMSGIATLTRGLVDRVHRANPRCEVAATRKTTPGFRAYEKRAVTIGGGRTHRRTLSDGILIKDNHLFAANVADAARRAKANRLDLPVEVEVSSMRDARAALEAGADWLLIDNLGPADARRIAEGARRIRPQVRIEISGGLTEANVVRYAPFADRVSLGRLTHSAPSADVTLELVAPKH